MKDKILDVKKEMERITKMCRLTRRERYDLVVEKIKSLDEKEMWILIEECKRDFESCDRLKVVKEYITIFLTGIGILLAVYEIVMRNVTQQISQQWELLCIVDLYIMISIVMLLITNRYRSNAMNRSRYMIDILERVYEESHRKHL